MIKAIFFLAIIFLIAGESYTFDIGTTEQVIFLVEGNQSSLDGLNIYQNGSNITISTHYLMKPDNFTIIFMLNDEIIAQVSMGGGSGWVDRVTYKKVEIIDTNENKLNKSENENKQEEQDSEDREKESNEEETTEQEDATSKEGLGISLFQFITFITLFFLLFVIVFILVKRKVP